MNHSERAEESLSSISRPEELGDFTATWRLIAISAAAMVIGVIASYVALALLKLIGLFTNLSITSVGAPPWCRPRAIIWACSR
jgi:hypothetical protein